VSVAQKSPHYNIILPMTGDIMLEKERLCKVFSIKKTKESIIAFSRVLQLESDV